MIPFCVAKPLLTVWLCETKKMLFKSLIAAWPWAEHVCTFCGTPAWLLKDMVEGPLLLCSVCCDLGPHCLSTLIKAALDLTKMCKALFS